MGLFKPKKRIGCLIPVVVVLVIIVGAVVGIGMAISGDGTAKKSLLAETMGLTEQQERDMLAIFEACGIGELKDVTQFQAGDNHTSYHVNDDETEHYSGVDNTIVVWVLNGTKEIEAIYFHDYDIYVNGAVIAPVSDYYVSSAQRDAYRVDAQLLVKQFLNYPDTAKFGAASKWAFGVQDGYDIIQSSVTAQNAFGVETTTDFQIKVDRTTNTAVSLIMDGTEYIQ